MKLSRHRIAVLSRDRNFLLKTAGAIGVAAMIIGYAVSHFTVDATVKSFFSLTDPEERIQELEDMQNLILESQGQSLSTEDLAEAIRYRESSENRNGVITELELIINSSTGVSADEKAMLKSLVRAIHGDDDERAAARSELEAYTSNIPPPRFAEAFFADALARNKEYEKALSHFQKEGENFDDADYSRRRVLELMIQENRNDELRNFYKSSRYGGKETLRARMTLASKYRDYGYLFLTVLEHDFGYPNILPIAMALFSAAIWFVIIGQFAGFERKQIATYGICLLLGIVSAVLTLYVVILQDEIQGFKMHPHDPVKQMTYCIAGIGLREELLKLLCFVPVAIFLRKRYDDLAAFIGASMVGLGFALNENLVYFGDTPGFTPWDRFLTANFFHVVLTAICGLSFYQMLRRRGRGWENFLADFLLMVFAHGAYDAVLIMPSLQEYSFIAVFFIYGLLAYRYFGIADSLARSNVAQSVSPLGIFVISSALLISVLFVAVCVGVPFLLALPMYLMSLAGMIPIIFLFINRFRNA